MKDFWFWFTRPFAEAAAGLAVIAAVIAVAILWAVIDIYVVAPIWHWRKKRRNL